MPFPRYLLDIVGEVIEDEYLAPQFWNALAYHYFPPGLNYNVVERTTQMPEGKESKWVMVNNAKGVALVIGVSQSGTE